MKKFYTNKKLVISFVTFFSIIFLLIIWGTGCGPASTKPRLKIAVWGHTDEVAILTQLVDEWQKEHPEVTAVVEHTPYGEYEKKLLIRISGGTAPDVMITEVTMFVSFWGMGAFMDLKPFIERDQSFNLDDFFPEVVDRFTKDGKLYSIPRDTAPMACVYYNKKLFDEAGVPYPTDDWNWDDLLEKAKKLTKITDDMTEAQYGFYSEIWYNFVYSNGGSLVDDVKNPTKFTMNEKKAIEGLQFFTDLILKHKVSPSITDMRNIGMGVQQLFMSGKLAMYMTGYWESLLFKNIKDFDWDVAMFPKGPTGIRKFETGGSGYCVLKSTKYPELAWDIVKTLSGEKAQIALADLDLAQPAMKSIAMGPHFAKSSHPPLNKAMLNKAVENVVYAPFHVRWREIKEHYLIPELELVYDGKQTVEEAAAKIEPAANRLLRAGN